MSRIFQIFIVLLVLDLSGLGLLWYGYSNMQSKKDEETALRASIAKEGEKGQKLAALRRTLALAEKDRALLRGYLFDPSIENQIRFISMLEQFGTSTTGALVETRSLDLTLSAPQLIRGDFTLTGTWSQLYHFLRIVESLPLRININRFDMKRTEAPTVLKPFETWSGSLSMDIVGLKPVK